MQCHAYLTISYPSIHEFNPAHPSLTKKPQTQDCPRISTLSNVTTDHIKLELLLLYLLKKDQSTCSCIMNLIIGIEYARMHRQVHSLHRRGIPFEGRRTEQKRKSSSCSIGSRKILDTFKFIKKPPFLLETKVNLTSEFRSCY